MAMHRFKKILFAVDADADNSAALNEAAMLAADNHASLTIVDVVDRLPADLQMAITAALPDELIKLVVGERLEVLARLKATALQSGAPEVESKVLTGRRSIEILRMVQSEGCDLLVKAVGAQSAPLRPLSSTDMHILRKCPCPVWMVRSGGRLPCQRVLAAVDYEPDEPVSDALNEAIIGLAASLAERHAAERHWVHAWRLPHERFLRSPRSGLDAAAVDALVAKERDRRQRWLRELVDASGGGLDARYDESAQMHICEGDPKTEVPHVASELDVDVIVMGTVGRVGIPGFFIGNTAEEILKRVECSVLAVKPEGFVSPVRVED